MGEGANLTMVDLPRIHHGNHSRGGNRMSEKNRPTIPACPICGKALNGDEDIFLAKWFEPKKWWVAYHYSAKTKDVGDSRMVVGGTTYHAVCGRAGYNPIMSDFSSFWDTVAAEKGDK